MPDQIINVRKTEGGATIGLLNINVRTPPISGFAFGGASGYNINDAAGIATTGIQVVGPVNTRIPAAQHPGTAPWILESAVSGVATDQPNWPNASGDVKFGHGVTWQNGVTKVVATDAKKFVYLTPAGPATGTFAR